MYSFAICVIRFRKFLGVRWGRPAISITTTRSLFCIWSGNWPVLNNKRRSLFSSIVAFEISSFVNTHGESGRKKHCLSLRVQDDNIHGSRINFGPTGDPLMNKTILSDAIPAINAGAITNLTCAPNPLGFNGTIKNFASWHSKSNLPMFLFFISFSHLLLLLLLRRYSASFIACLCWWTWIDKYNNRKDRYRIVAWLFAVVSALVLLLLLSSSLSVDDDENFKFKNLDVFAHIVWRRISWEFVSSSSSLFLSDDTDDENRDSIFKIENFTYSLSIIKREELLSSLSLFPKRLLSNHDFEFNCGEKHGEPFVLIPHKIFVPLFCWFSSLFSTSIVFSIFGIDSDFSI